MTQIYIVAALLALVEGLTEFIPVSSTGHLILFSHFLGFNTSYSNLYEIFIQLGAILAVVVLYLPKFIALIPWPVRKETGFSGWTGIFKLLVVSIPALIMGFLFDDFIDEVLFAPLPVSVALITGGVVLVFIERWIKQIKISSIEEISYRDCFLIGIFQCLALWPGMSRSGSTIVGGMVLGLDKKTAAEFSFFAAVPIMCAAVGYKLLKHIAELTPDAWGVLAFGFVLSFIIAIFAIKFFMTLLQRFSLAGFGVYRIVLGIVILGCIYQGIL